MEPPEEEIEMQKAGKEIHDQSPAHWKLDEYGDGQRQQCKSKQKVQLQRRSQRQTYNENSAMENELGDGRQVVIVGEEIEDMGGCDIDRQQPFPADDAGGFLVYKPSKRREIICLIIYLLYGRYFRARGQGATTNSAEWLRKASLLLLLPNWPFP
jgi:hypothetical protein